MIEFQEVIEAVKSLGVPCGVLGYVLWRGDKLLNRLVTNFDKFGTELTNIKLAIHDLISKLGHG